VTLNQPVKRKRIWDKGRGTSVGSSAWAQQLLWREPIGWKLNQFEPGKLTPYSQRLIFLIGTSVNRRRYPQDGCPSQRKGWYQKTDVASPHQAFSYHGGTGRDRWGCAKGTEVKQAQEFKHPHDIRRQPGTRPAGRYRNA